MKASILVGQLDDKRNESALVRTAEALGINSVHVVNGSETDLRTAVACGAEKHVSIHHYDTYKEFCGAAHDRNLSIVPIENTRGAIPIEESPEYPVNPVFVVGNEGKGVPKAVIEASDLTVKITQSVNSYVRCLNTTVSGSIVMHDWFEARYNRDKAQHEFEAQAEA